MVVFKPGIVSLLEMGRLDDNWGSMKRIQRELDEKGGGCLRSFIIVFKDSWRAAGSAVCLAPRAVSG